MLQKGMIKLVLKSCDTPWNCFQGASGLSVYRVVQGFLAEKPGHSICWAAVVEGGQAAASSRASQS
jgi:hypothetical protein